MTRLVLVLALIFAGAHAAQAQTSPQAATTGQSAGQPAVQGTAPQDRAPPARGGQQKPAAGQAVSPDAQAAVPAVPNGMLPNGEQAAPPDPQAQKRELQEQGREAAAKARELQATDPAAANKVMQDYYRMRNEKMIEIQKASRQQAADERIKKREDAKAKEAAAQAEREAMRRDKKNARDNDGDSRRESLRERRRQAREREERQSQ